MPQIVFSKEELLRVAAMVEDLDPAKHELFDVHRPLLNAADWEFLCEYVREKIASALMIGLVARSVSRVAQEHGVADERGADHFLRSKAWVHNFGVLQSGDEYFANLSGACGNRLGKACDALVEIAQDRLFGTVDDEYQRLLASGA
jgi:hypothetical protein